MFAQDLGRRRIPKFRLLQPKKRLEWKWSELAVGEGCTTVLQAQPLLQNGKERAKEKPSPEALRQATEGVEGAVEALRLKPADGGISLSGSKRGTTVRVWV